MRSPFSSNSLALPIGFLDALLFLCSASGRLVDVVFLGRSAGFRVDAGSVGRVKACAVGGLSRGSRGALALSQTVERALNGGRSAASGDGRRLVRLGAGKLGGIVVSGSGTELLLLVPVLLYGGDWVAGVGALRSDGGGRKGRAQGCQRRALADADERATTDGGVEAEAVSVQVRPKLDGWLQVADEPGTFALDSEHSSVGTLAHAMSGTICNDAGRARASLAREHRMELSRNGRVSSARSNQMPEKATCRKAICGGGRADRAKPAPTPTLRNLLQVAGQCHSSVTWACDTFRHFCTGARALRGQRQASSPTAPRHRSSGKRFGDKIRGEGDTATATLARTVNKITVSPATTRPTALRASLTRTGVGRRLSARQGRSGMSLRWQLASKHMGFLALHLLCAPRQRAALPSPHSHAAFGMSSAEISG
ncbi:hypothetical protein L1887_60520 [Cichorium endivia]|nr:hypothetical protein L1887_60520 [Cichorium endivia]